MDIFDKNVCVLHSNNPCTLKLFVFEVKVEFTAAFRLALVFPIDSLASLGCKRNRNNGSLTEGLSLEAINHVVNLRFHLMQER